MSESCAPRSLEHIDHSQRLARGAREPDAGRLARRPVEIDWLRWIGRVDAGRQEPHEQASERFQQRKEQQRQDNIEAGVEIGDGAAGIGFDRDQRWTDPIEKSQRQCAADHAVDQIADRQALGGGVAA